MRLVGAMSAIVLLGVGAGARAQVASSRTNAAHYSESIRATVVTRTGATVRERRVLRDIRYTVEPRDTQLLVTADSISLVEVVNGVSRRLDVDAVIGGRWTLAGGSAKSVTDRPFVPAEVREVSDIAVAMDDFWPPAMPTMAVGAEARLGHVDWERLADSASHQRHRWKRRTGIDSVRLSGDSVPMQVSERMEESGSVASVGARAVAWRRDVRTTVVTGIRGRVVRAEVEQAINVRRDF